MLSSQLMQLMKSLTKHDFKEMRKVVRSPFFNQREDVILLFDYIDEHLKDATSIFLKETVFEKIFPKKEYDDTYMRQIMSYLYKITQNYLVTAKILNDEMSSTIMRIKAVQERNADKILEKYLTESVINIENSQWKNAKYHYTKYELLKEEHNYKGNKKRETELNLQSLSDELDYFYISERLRNACLMFAHQTVSKFKYSQPLLEDTLKVAEHYLDSVPSIAAYYYTFKALSNPDNEQYYTHLRHIILHKSHLFPQNEQRDLYLLATNYCIKKLNKGEKKYAIEALNLYQGRIKDNVLLENDSLPHYTYKNIRALAIKAEDFDWAEKFLYDFKKYLPEKDRENIFEYNKGIFLFRKGNYPDAMILLQKVNLNDILYNLDARQLLARIYFEQNEINPLISLIESAKVYLHRQKGIGYHHEMYANYFRFLEKMLKIDMKSPQSRTILRGEVVKTEFLAERDWLMHILS